MSAITDQVEHRDPERPDRRASRRGGRRGTDQKKPWYLRRRLWLAAATMGFVWWRRLRRRLPT